MERWRGRDRGEAEGEDKVAPGTELKGWEGQSLLLPLYMNVIPNHK